MTQTEHWDRIRELFEEVSEHPPEARREALQKLCPNDANLQNEILSLLEHDERAEPRFLTPLEHPAIATEHECPDPLIGARLGKCVIRRIVATGGMGVVYEAEQENPRRIVAIKVMKSLAWSRMARRRFEFEVESLARLTHPHIAQIYDADTVRTAGLAEGMPYFVMEYIPDACPITEYADRHKLDRKERLEQFLQVCDAIQYGHQKGIIHRDLKPANILIGVSGQVKVIDFGVARATDCDVAATTQLTDVGQLIGTLRYMSPEQCAADPLGLDVRSDVYALGVVLYELLCGRPPYEVSTTSITQAARAICEQLPERPSAADRSLRGDLEIILLKALEKDREKRYQSVADLSRDIRHYLNREPIEVRGPNFVASAGRWMRRHPTWTTAVSAAIVGVTILATVWITVLLAHLEPYEIVPRNGTKEAVLRAFSGKVLHTWRSELEDKGLGIIKLTHTDGPSSKRLAIIGFPASPHQSRSGQLCAFEIESGKYNEPAWCSHIEERDVPTLEPNRAFHHEDFHASGLLGVEDIFPEIPGREFIVTYSHEFSRRALRIYSIKGEVLYQIWHDGNIMSAFWLNESGILVLAGTNDEGTWDKDLPYKEGDCLSPKVVWALKPTLGLRSNLYVCTQNTIDCMGRPWYRWVIPADSDLTFSKIDVWTPPQASKDDGRHCLIAFTYDSADSKPVAGWIIDADGVKSDGHPYQTSPYLQIKSKLPPIERYYLSNLRPTFLPDPPEKAENNAARP